MWITRYRSLVMMSAAESVSNIGTWIAMQAVYAMLIFQRGGGVTQSTLIYLTGLGPMLLLGPVAGWLCDRFDRRKLMITSEVLSALFIAGLIFTTKVPLIYTLLLLQSTVSTIMSPARGSVVPDVVAPEDLTRANAFLMQIAGITKICAPIIGASIVAVVSPGTAMLFDVVSFILSAVILTTLPTLPPRKAARPANAEKQVEASLWRTLKGLLQQAPIVVSVLPFLFLLGAVLLSFDITAPVYVRDILHGSIALKGAIASLVGLGMGAGAFVLMIYKGRRNVYKDYVVGLLLIMSLPAVIAAGAFVGSVMMARTLMLLGAVVGGFGMGIFNVQSSTLIQQLAPAGWLGRISGATQSVVTAGQALAMVITPILVPSHVSFGVFFGLATLLLGIASLRPVVALVRGELKGRPPIPSQSKVADGVGMGD